VAVLKGGMLRVSRSSVTGMSTVTLRAAEEERSGKVAVSPGWVGTPPSQLAGADQLPAAGAFQVPSTAAARWEGAASAMVAAAKAMVRFGR
jgi:hypothetical protein